MQLPPWLLWLTLVIRNYVSGSEFRRVCYYGSWTNHLQNTNARFQVSDIDPHLCTHVIFAFAKVNTDRLTLEKSEEDDDNGQYRPNAAGKFYDFTNLKLKNPNLKTLLSFGGETTSESLHKVAEFEKRRITFAKNCLTFLRDRNFDGIDIDWEYPLAFKDAFTDLLKDMRLVFDRSTNKTGSERLILSIAGAAGKDNIDASYDVKQIIKYVDFINVMAYDYYGPTWSHETGFTGPLFSRASVSSYNQELSQNWTIHYWIQKGAPPEKLVLGTTSSALGFKLQDKSNHVIGAPFIRDGSVKGPYTRTDGHLAYYEVCKKGVQVWDDEQKVMYSYEGDEWYGFDSPRSMIEKVKFAKAVGLGGVMMWILDRDDFSGRHCGQGRYPLLHALASAAENRTFTRAPTTRAPPTTTTILTTQRFTRLTQKTLGIHVTGTVNLNNTSPAVPYNSSEETTTLQEATSTDVLTTISTTEKRTQKPSFIVFTIGGAQIQGLSSVLFVLILLVTFIFK